MNTNKDLSEKLRMKIDTRNRNFQGYCHNSRSYYPNNRNTSFQYHYQSYADHFFNNTNARSHNIRFSSNRYNSGYLRYPCPVRKEKKNNPSSISSEPIRTEKGNSSMGCYEEDTLRKIRTTSDMIKKQLMGSDCSVTSSTEKSKESENEPLRNKMSSSESSDNFKVPSIARLKRKPTKSTEDLIRQQVKDKKLRSSEGIARQHLKKKRKDELREKFKKDSLVQQKSKETYDVKEISDRILKHITEMNKSRLLEFINSDNSHYDEAFHYICKQKSFELTKALRDLSHQEKPEACEIVNAIIPDFSIKIEELPIEVIKALSSTFEELHKNIGNEAICTLEQVLVQNEITNEKLMEPSSSYSENRAKTTENAEVTIDISDSDEENFMVKKEFEDLRNGNEGDSYSMIEEFNSKNTNASSTKAFGFTIESVETILGEEEKERNQILPMTSRIESKGIESSNIVVDDITQQCEEKSEGKINTVVTPNQDIPSKFVQEQTDTIFSSQGEIKEGETQIQISIEKNLHSKIGSVWVSKDIFPNSVPQNRTIELEAETQKESCEGILNSHDLGSHDPNIRETSSENEKMHNDTENIVVQSTSGKYDNEAMVQEIPHLIDSNTNVTPIDRSQETLDTSSPEGNTSDPNDSEKIINYVHSTFPSEAKTRQEEIVTPDCFENSDSNLRPKMGSVWVCENIFPKAPLQNDIISEENETVMDFSDQHSVNPITDDHKAVNSFDASYVALQDTLKQSECCEKDNRLTINENIASNKGLHIQVKNIEAQQIDQKSVPDKEILVNPSRNFPQEIDDSTLSSAEKIKELEISMNNFQPKIGSVWVSKKIFLDSDNQNETLHEEVEIKHSPVESLKTHCPKTDVHNKLCDSHSISSIFLQPETSQTLLISNQNENIDNHKSQELELNHSEAVNDIRSCIGQSNNFEDNKAIIDVLTSSGENVRTDIDSKGIDDEIAPKIATVMAPDVNIPTEMIRESNSVILSSSQIGEENIKKTFEVPSKNNCCNFQLDKSSALVIGETFPNSFLQNETISEEPEIEKRKDNPTNNRILDVPTNNHILDVPSTHNNSFDFQSWTAPLLFKETALFRTNENINSQKRQDIQSTNKMKRHDKNNVVKNKIITAESQIITESEINNMETNAVNSSIVLENISKNTKKSTIQNTGSRGNETINGVIPFTMKKQVRKHDLNEKRTEEKSTDVKHIDKQSSTIQVPSENSSKSNNKMISLEEGSSKKEIISLTINPFEKPKLISDAIKLMKEIDEKVDILNKLRQSIFIGLSDSSTETEKVISGNEKPAFSVDPQVESKKAEVVPFSSLNCLEVVLFCKILHDQEECIVGTDSGRIHYYHISGEQPIRTITVCNSPITSMKLLKFSNYYYICAGNNTDLELKIFNHKTTNIERKLHLEDPVQVLRYEWGFLFIGGKRGFLTRYDWKRKLIQFEDRISASCIKDLRTTKEGPRRILVIWFQEADGTSHIHVRDAMTVLHIRAVVEIKNLRYMYVRHSLAYLITDVDISFHNYHHGTYVRKICTKKSFSSMIVQGNLMILADAEGIYGFDLKTNRYLGCIEEQQFITLMAFFGQKLLCFIQGKKTSLVELPQHYRMLLDAY